MNRAIEQSSNRGIDRRRARARHERLIVIGVAIGACCLTSSRVEAQIAARQARVEVVVPKDPTPVMVDTTRVLVYELHVTNFGPGPLALSEIDVHDAQNPAAPLATYRDSVLRGMVAPAGPMMMTMSDTARTRLDPGFREIVFVWLPIRADRPPPTVLRHRLVFDILDSASRRRDQGTQSALDSILVPVATEPPPALESPLRGGQWVAGSGPSNSSDHRRSLAAVDGHARIGQRFAIDWNMVGPNGDLFRGDEHRNESYWGYGQPVHAVAAGQVVAIVDSIADHPPHGPLPPITLGNIAGNYVSIRIAAHRYATFAHLQHGSIRVHVGQSVAAGSIIALLGSTGQTTAPHLHFQISDGPSVLDSERLPYVLPSYTDLGSGATFEEGKHPSVGRRNALPGENEVVGLP